MANVYNDYFSVKRKLNEALRRVNEDEDVDIKVEQGEKMQNSPTGTEDSVPYTPQDQLMSSITDTCKQQFGADFSNIQHPMLYHPKDGDITLSGEIPTMNNAKFQFRYKDSSGNGCYLWTSPVQLTDESLQTLSVMQGVFKNWKKELSTSEDIKPMTYKSAENLNESRTEKMSEKSTIIPTYRRGDDIL